MPVALTLSITKLAASLSRLFGRGGGGALPGLIGERLDDGLVRKLASQLSNGVILVTGTNGKTTTTKLIASALTASGERVLTNRSGSNLRRGILSSLIDASDLRGRIKATIALFEVDEASLRLVATELAPKHIVVLNLFRDQLDRYGELDTTAAMIGQGIAATTAQLYLNADDPLVASLAKYASEAGRVHYFGIEGLPAATSGHQTAADSDRCPVCRRRLEFSRVFYGHIGHYSCHNRDFSRPRPGVVITSLDRASLSGSDFTVAIGGKRHQATMPLPGTYNLYNALAMLAVGSGLGLDNKQLLETLAATTAAFGRVEQLEIRGRKLYLLLIKNPAGFTQVLETFLLGAKAPHVLMAVNDNAADGRDVSWLWDVPLESLTPTKPIVITTGIRGLDMALRLKYAGIEAVNVEEFNTAINRFIDQLDEGETGYILPTYTAMIALRELLGRQTTLEAVVV